ncbi:uncharacterized protein LOC134768527 [Penaeus indicus]|uniref:uncharacterized protein LOC134768527 n=1 Tax=Penaeus indicus TaxID=29960 RepID=UPI00300C9EC7
MKPATMIRSLGNVFMLVTLVVGKPASEVNVDSSGPVVNLQGSGDPGRAQVNVDMPGQVNMSADGQALVLLLSEKGQGIRVDINGVLVSDLVDDNDLTTSAPGQVTTPPVYQTTQPPVPQTSQPPVPQTSQPPVPQTSQPPVPPTTQPPVPPSTQPPVPPSTQPPVPPSTQPPVPPTTQPPVPPTTTAQPTTQGPPKINHNRNCLTKKEEGFTSSGIYTLQPFDCCPDRDVDAPCDMTADGGGWTVIQRRQENPPHQEDFYRTWGEYVDGFGDLTGEFWLGLDNIHALTTQTNYELRIDLADWDGATTWARYSTFLVGDRANNYQLQLGSYSGDAGNSFYYHNMMPFSTKDGPVKNDCPKTSHGGWWYNSCHYANLNGVYRNAFNNDGDSIVWFSFRGPNYSLKFSEMKIRPTAYCLMGVLHPGLIRRETALWAGSSTGKARSPFSPSWESLVMQAQGLRLITKCLKSRHQSLYQRLRWDSNIISKVKHSTITRSIRIRSIVDLPGVDPDCTGPWCLTRNDHAPQQAKMIRLVSLLVTAALVVGLPPPDANVNIEWPGDVHVKAKGKTLIVLLGEDNENIKVNINATLIDGDSGLLPATPAPTVPPQPVPVISEKNCLDLKNNFFQSSGIYVVAPYDCCPDKHVSVYCDMDMDGGGWTVIQRRDQFDTQLNFFRGWDDYVSGFGSLSEEFWLGLDNIHALTNQTNYEIRFDLADFEGKSRWAKYSKFLVQSKASNYELKISGYSGNAGDAMSYHNGMVFTTKDSPVYSECPEKHRGAWWYNDCLHANLNGQYLAGPHNTLGIGVNWYEWRRLRYSLKLSEMKIRPKQ